jgi:hypothetical protein
VPLGSRRILLPGLGPWGTIYAMSPRPDRAGRSGVYPDMSPVRKDGGVGKR